MNLSSFDHLTIAVRTNSAGIPVCMLFVLASSLCWSATTRGQTFSTTFDIPPDIAPIAVGSNTQVNVYTGGSLPEEFRAGATDGTSTSIEINVMGGTIGERSVAHSGSVVNVFDGRIGERFFVAGGELNTYGGFISTDGGRADGMSAGGNARVNVYGGKIGDWFEASDSSEININGGVIGLGFTAADDVVVNVHDGSLGRLANFYGSDTTLNVYGGLVDAGLNSWGIVNLFGGEIGFNSDLRSLRMHGGTIGDHLRATSLTIYADDVHIDGLALPGLENTGDFVGVRLTASSVLSGTLADGTPFAFSYWDDRLYGFAAITVVMSEVPHANPDVITASTDPVGWGVRQGQTLNVDEGGVLPNNYNVGAGSVVVVEPGGSVGDNLEVVGARLTVNGGRIGSHFDAFIGAEVAIHGGTFGDYFSAHTDSSVAIHGGDFRLDGEPIAELTDIGQSLQVNVPTGSLLTGVFEDGTPFSFAGRPYIEFFADGTLTLHSVELPTIDPTTINAPTDPVPLGIRAGQTLVVSDGGSVDDNFNAGFGSTVKVERGATLGYNLEAIGATVEVSGGTVGHSLEARLGSTVIVTDGVIGSVFRAFESEVHIAGGTVGSMRAEANSSIHISGGEYARGFRAESESTVTIYGIDFSRDGESFTDVLVPNAPFEIEDRGGTLSGTLADGSPFSFELNSQLNYFGPDHFNTESTLNVVLMLAGDFNNDGAVNLADYTLWRDNLGATAGILPNDPSGAAIGEAQYRFWKNSFGRTLSSQPPSSTLHASVPEPATATVFMTLLVATSWCRWHR